MHRMTFTTPSGKTKSYIVIEADSREIAEEQFRNDFDLEPNK